MRNCNCHGFNLIELMIAIALSATIIATMISSFAQLYNLFLYNTKFLALNGELRLAMQVVKNDADNAGVFGSFSFHHLSTNLYQTITGSKGGECSNVACQYETATVGVKSFTSDYDGVISGVPLINGSEILRIQSGKQNAYALTSDDTVLCQGGNCVLKKCDDGYYLNLIRFASNGLESSATSYMLSSANRLYGLNYSRDSLAQIFNPVSGGAGDFALNLAGDCDVNSVLPRIKVESYVDGEIADIFDPDIHTMELVNLVTSYYYVGAATHDSPAGLYLLRYDGKSSNPTPVLISKAISKLNISYLLDNAPTFNHVYQNDNFKRFVTCTTRDMERQTSVCFNKWNNIVAVNISLTAQGQSSSAASDKFEQSVTETVSWKL